MRQRHSPIFLRVVDKNENLLAWADTARDFYAVGYRAKNGSDAGLLRHPFGRRRHQLVVKDRSDVGDSSLAIGAGDCGWLIVEPSVALAILQKDFVVGCAAFELLRPNAGFSAAPGTGDGNIFFERVVLLDSRAQGIDEKSRLTLRQKRVEFIFHAGPWTENQMAALAHIFEQVVRKILRQHIQTRCGDQFVTIERSVGTDHIDGLGNLSQRLVVTLQQSDVVILLCVFLKLDRPMAVIGVEQRYLRLRLRTTKAAFRFGKLVRGLAQLRRKRAPGYRQGQRERRESLPVRSARCATANN